MIQPKKRKFNISRASDEKEPTKKITERPERLNMKQKTETGRRLNAEIYLPVSQKDIVLNHILVAPEDLYVGSYNRREQSLLSLKDPAMKQLVDSISSEKQRDPILIRKVDGKDGWELVFGSRRLFAIREINKIRGLKGGDLLKVRCWVSVMSDLDAEHLSVSENNDREDISIYERALYFKRLYDEGSTVEMISGKEKIGTTTVKEGIRIASIDLAFVKMLPSPNFITRQSGLQILKAIDKAGKDKVQEFFEKHANMVFDNMVDLQKTFLAFTGQGKSSSRHARSPKEFYSSSNKKKLKAKCIKHRSVEGQYKIDLFDMSEKQMDRIYNLIEKLK